MIKELDIGNWERKEHFAFFSAFEEPFFGITVELDCTKAYAYCKQHQISFFLYYLHLSLKAAHSVEPFRYRISENKVIIYDRIDASPTIDRSDGTFGFSYMTYHEKFDQFNISAQKEIERVRTGKGLLPAVSGENVIHYSALPWIKFTSISHARSFSFHDSCPKITMGKMTLKDRKRVMPVSIHVHHGLMDALHVSQFIDKYQQLLNRN